jgi:hypothetical protein
MGEKINDKYRLLKSGDLPGPLKGFPVTTKGKLGFSSFSVFDP